MMIRRVGSVMLARASRFPATGGDRWLVGSMVRLNEAGLTIDSMAGAVIVQSVNEVRILQLWQSCDPFLQIETSGYPL